MGKDTVYLFEGDGACDIEYHLIELFKVKFKKYLKNNKVLTKKIINKRLGDVVKGLELDKPDLNIDTSKACYFHYLGCFILQTGADLPEELKHKIVESTLPERDGIKWYTKEFEEQRKILLNDLRDKILNYKTGQIVKLIENGGKPFHVPSVLIDWNRIKLLIEKGCTLYLIAELLDNEYDKKITPQIIIENIEYNEPLSGIFDQTYYNIQIKLLKPVIEQFFKKGIKTPEELSKNFICAENPNGIPLIELKQLIKGIFKVDSWKHAIAIATTTIEKEKEAYLKLWNYVKSFLTKHMAYMYMSGMALVKQLINDKLITNENYENELIILRAQTHHLSLIEQVYQDIKVIIARGRFFEINEEDFKIINNLIDNFQVSWIIR